MSASEIAEELNVPTVYVEEELEILKKGQNGKYGMLRRLDNGKYAINIVLLDKDTVEEAHKIYTEQLPKICDTIVNYIEAHKQEYLSYYNNPGIGVCAPIPGLLCKIGLISLCDIIRQSSR